MRIILNILAVPRRSQGADVITLFALLATLAGAVLIYLASSQQRLLPACLPVAARWSGWLLVALGTAGWCHDSGVGVGIAAALTTLMLSWVLLPYLAWWRIGTPDADPS